MYKLTVKRFDEILDLALKYSLEEYNVNLLSNNFLEKIKIKIPTHSKFKNKKKNNKNKNKKQKKLKNIKGPTSAFIYFTKIQNLENIENNIFTMKKSEMSSLWANLKTEEKEPYLKLAQMDRARYNIKEYCNFK